MTTTTEVKMPAVIAEAIALAQRTVGTYWVVPGEAGMTIVDEMPMVDHFQVSPSGAVYFAYWNESIGDVELVKVSFDRAE